MNIEASLINGGLPNLFSPEYDRFAAKWDAVRSTFVENHWYWSGRRERWEWFAPAHFTVMDVGLEAVRENLDHAAYRIYPEVARSWERVRAIQGDAIWNPRDGGWFTWRRLGPPPPPPPLPEVPKDLWIQRMNEELAAIDKLNLSPAEREQARAAVRSRYLGQ